MPRLRESWGFTTFSRQPPFPLAEFAPPDKKLPVSSAEGAKAQRDAEELGGDSVVGEKGGGP